MKRRSFLKGLFAAPMAAPAALSEMTKGVETHPRGNYAYPSHMGGISGGVTGDHIAGLQTDLTAWLSRSPPVASYTPRVNRLDADLTVHRSFSLSTRVRMQAMRDIERETQNTADYLEQQIAEAMGVKT